MATRPYEDSPPTITERYGVATATSDLTCGGGMVPEGGGMAAADILMAAAMVDGLGSVLVRLRQEWDGSAKPSKPGPRLTQALAGYIRREDEESRAEAERNYSEFGPRRPGKWRQPPGSYATRAADRATAWYAGELRLLAVNLRSRREAVERLTEWAVIKGIHQDAVSEAIEIWLSPTCPHCKGHGFPKIPDQPSLSARICRPCEGTGSRPRPEDVGRIIRHMDYCEGVLKGGTRRKLGDR